MEELHPSHFKEWTSFQFHKAEMSFEGLEQDNDVVNLVVHV